MIGWGWFLASVLYVIPVLHGIKQFELIEEDCKEWMRMEGEWYPLLAKWMASMAIIFWPVLMLLDSFSTNNER